MRRENDPDIQDEPDFEIEPDFAEEHTPSATDPPIARPDDDNPDERWDKPTEV
ncbi:hypothetical protein ACQP1K_06845 [Sphaerimonospora sp. CA-214678]|uniref:hypothetical protein n=1 Tax=Sphaerimonospora sp. CA-214678 TaxID=3240029 RepID=UPI003D92E6FF